MPKQYEVDAYCGWRCWHGGGVLRSEQILKMTGVKKCGDVFISRNAIEATQYNNFMILSKEVLDVRDGLWDLGGQVGAMSNEIERS